MLAKAVIMPALGMAQETGVLLRWLKAEGDEVAVGEPLMEIETDKATVEVEAPASGILTNLTAAPGDEVPVGQVIGLILAPGESAPSATATPTSNTPAQPVASTAPISQPHPGPVTRMWQTMVERLTHSWTTVPHFYLTREVKVSQLMRWRDKAQQRTPEKITITDLLVKVVAAALRQNPRLNGMWHNNTIAFNDEINLGLAVAVEDGLLVPVIHQADQLGLIELAGRRREVVARAQTGKLALEDLRGGTFTLSNLGMYGIDAFNAIVNPPQAAILAVGALLTEWFRLAASRRSNR